VVEVHPAVAAVAHLGPVVVGLPLPAVVVEVHPAVAAVAHLGPVVVEVHPAVAAGLRLL
jgi:hypothetical protein